MANKKKAKSNNRSNSTELAPENDELDLNESNVGMTTLQKRLASLALLGYLTVVLLGPLSNPVASEFLTRPLSRVVAPLHRGLYLGHGYRFFGPDPGPAHIVVYRVNSEEHGLVEGKFPDRDKHWPRLLYHRWFMLSESIFNEHALTPTKEGFDEADKELGEQIDLLKSKGKYSLSQKMAIDRRENERRYQDAKKRTSELVQAVAGHLIQLHDGEHIELFLQERYIPFAFQVMTGADLDEKQFLTPLRKIGEFQKDPTGKVVSLELQGELLEEQQ